MNNRGHEGLNNSKYWIFLQLGQPLSSDLIKNNKKIHFQYIKHENIFGKSVFLQTQGQII